MSTLHFKYEGCSEDQEEDPKKNEVFEIVNIAGKVCYAQDLHQPELNHNQRSH